jgi:hypothetical protein
VTLTADRLRSLLHYDADTGVFLWLTRPNRRIVAGSVAGTVCGKGGRRHIAVDGRNYLSHRLAWLYQFGHWPTAEIDHINGDPSDNRICNLRDVDRVTNAQNQRSPKAVNKSGFLGVHRKTITGSWVASIGHKKKIIYLGAFNTASEAHAAYLETKRLIHIGNTL